MNEQLIAAMKEKRAVLFVGSGVSQNLNIPSWSGLVDYVAEDLGFNPSIFKAQGGYLELFEYYRLVRGSVNALAAWMDTNWHSEIDIGKSEIHKLIVELDFPVIYTTNYDRLLEMAYDYYKKPYQKITKVSDIADADPAVPHIVKYHGDFDDPQSLVLTESDYFGRLDFESPLDIRLRADLLGKSVLYIGYSLTDINIRYLLYRLQRLWEVARSRTATPSSFVFLSRPNLIADRVLRDRSVVPLVSNAIDPEEGLLDFLNSLNDGQKST